MKMLAILAAVLPVVVQAQVQVTGFTPGQERALQQAFSDAVAWVRQGNAPIHSRATEVHGGQPLATEGFAVRCTALMGTNDMQFWTFAPGVYEVTAGDPPQSSSPTYLRYVVVTVAAAAPREEAPDSTWASELVNGTCSGPLPAPAGSWPVTITTLTDPASQATTTGWQCVCSAGADCAWTPLVGSQPVAAPKGRVLPEGRWQGAGCYLTTCIEIAGSPSLPAVCAP